MRPDTRIYRIDTIHDDMLKQMAAARAAPRASR